MHEAPLLIAAGRPRSSNRPLREAGGKAPLSHLPQAMLEDYLARVVFEKITPDTVDKIAALRNELSGERSSGLAFILEEFTPGIAGVARPIPGPSGHPPGSINIALAMARFDEAPRARCITVLTRAAATIDQQLRSRLR